ncbi:MAG TPA: threonine/serine dehydratase [Hellea balneolensis]|uniref:Threonine/serine dehydratase n=1 Tax=Hellea balneolensis TaxID=287478 RepID=A0A7C3C1E8_9PROT|nr:threonine/serine dehydratase [Hellea balneolensis]
MSLEIPTYSDIEQAAKRLAGHAVVTPIVMHVTLNKIAGVRLVLKNETAQKTGTFKYRGAYSRLSTLDAKERARGVVAFSSGNHAQGVALAAKQLGIDAVIVMPLTAPEKKRRGTLSHGAKIIDYDPATQSREKIAADIAARENRVLVPAYDDPHVIAGQGTCARELIQQCRHKNISLDALITPIGGGGLCAGTNLSCSHDSPATHVYAAEPMNYDDTRRSLIAGHRVVNRPAPPSMCDALMSPSPGEITFAINQTALSGVFTVTDEECLLTIGLMRELTGIILEPGGAAALAAALTRRTPFHPTDTVGIILSGGNVDDRVLDMAQGCKNRLD